MVRDRGNNGWCGPIVTGEARKKGGEWGMALFSSIRIVGIGIAIGIAVAIGFITRFAQQKYDLDSDPDSDSDFY